MTDKQRLAYLAWLADELTNVGAGLEPSAPPSSK